MLIRAIRHRSFSTIPTRKLLPNFDVPVIPGSETVLRELQADLIDGDVEKGAFTVAIDACKRVLEICTAINEPAPEAGVRCKLARIYEFNGNYDKAALEWTQVIASKADIGPAAPSVKAARIMSLLHCTRLNEAAAAAKSAADSYSHDDRFKVLQAVVAYRNCNLTEAVALLQRVSETSDFYGQSLLLRGTCLNGMQDEEKATKTLNLAAKWFEEREKDWGAVAAWLQSNDVEECQKGLKFAEAHPNHPLIAEALRVLASHLLLADPVVAEGLFRSAVTRCANQNHYVPTYFTQCVYASVLSDFAYLLCHLEFNGQPRVKAALHLLQTPLLFGAKSYSPRGYMQDSEIVKLAEGEAKNLHDVIGQREQNVRPGMWWWMEELSHAQLLKK